MAVEEVTVEEMTVEEMTVEEDAVQAMSRVLLLILWVRAHNMGES